MGLFEDKAALRSRMKVFLAALDEGEARERSALACENLLSTQVYAEARVVLCFLSMPREIQTERLIDAVLSSGRTVAAPRIERPSTARMSFAPLSSAWRSLGRDRFGIPEPEREAAALSLDEIGRESVLVVTPGLAFDASGARLGRGAGYYDAFLRDARAASRRLGGRLVAAGLCYSFQILQSVPASEVDERVDCIAADSECAQKAHRGD